MDSFRAQENKELYLTNKKKKRDRISPVLIDPTTFTQSKLLFRKIYLVFRCHSLVQQILNKFELFLMSMTYRETSLVEFTFP